MSGLRISVFGGVRATRDGEPLALGGPRPRSLVAALVVAGGRPVGEDALIEAAWDGAPPPAARQALHTYVARLRGALEPGRSVRTAATVLVRNAAGYALALGPDRVDAWALRDLAARGAAALAEQRPHEAITLLDRAIATAAGAPFADLDGRAFLQAETAALDELRTGVREDRAAAGLAVGADSTLLDELEALTREHPLRERAWELRARALYRAGRQADALATLRAAREVLADELGVDPGPGLREAERAVLAQDPALLHRAPAADAPAPAAAAPRRALPAPLTSLLGRDADLDGLRADLDAHRLVTVVGPGGVGKTRLALAAARERAGTVWFAELADLSAGGGNLLAAVVAETAGVVTAQAPAALAAALGDSEALLVLDNCEHVLDAVADLLAVLLPSCPGLRVLATSREPVTLPGEHLHELAPLTPADAEALFVERAGAAAPGWIPSDDERTRVAAVCRALDGLPLAVELAAARSRTLSVAEIADALDDRFGLLVGGPRTAPARHRSVARTVALSVDELSAGQRDLFGRVSLFAGGFDASAAAAVAGRPVHDELAALVAKSLVRSDVTGSGPRRFDLLETLRAFGGTVLDDGGRPDATTRHRRWVTGLVAEADRHWLGHDAARWFGRVRIEQPNVRVAFTAALADGSADAVDDALRLAGALGWYWYRFGRIAEGIGWASAVIAAAGPDADPAALGAAHFAVGPLRYLAGDHAGARADVVAGLERMDPAVEPTKVARGLAFRAYLAAATDPAAAPAFIERAYAVARAAADGPGESEALAALGQLARLGGDPGTALERFGASAAVAHACGHGFAEGSARWNLVKVHLDRGDATAALAEALPMVQFMGGQPDVTSWLVGLHALAGALGLAGDGERGARLLGAVSAVGGEVGFQPAQMDPQDSERNLALVRSALGTGPHPAERFATAFGEGVAGGRAAVDSVLDELGGTPAVLREAGRSA
ncbi:BTAD domain-containing putative transcriptional regulator [Pseudonocardia nematodicida]|uniref:BTAD domain-containing putative transcriptional regulator n=1 Tax=Pseudonocardia nematodicida TaxID=1206997 RepID=A0ABV1KIE6_9PSEU